jgi:hypothetical protein
MSFLQKSIPRRTRRGMLCNLLQAELAEQKDPNEVHPADHCAKERNGNANDKTEQAALLGERGPSDHNLGHPVDKGDHEQQKLHQTALLVKPIHEKYLRV